MHINLLFGFLGAGKTTLVRRLLAKPVDTHKTAVIVNEFGEVGVDGQILSGASVDVIELTSGCLCCTLRGALPLAIEELRDMQQVERVIVEATGVAQPAEMLESLAEGGEGLEAEVGRLVTVVDTAKLPKLLPMLGEFYARQIAGADIVVLNKCDLVAPADIERARTQIRELNPGADILFAEQGDVNNEYLMRGVTRRPSVSTPHEEAATHHVHEPPAETFVLRPSGHATRRDLEDFFGALSDHVWRAKGYVALDGECHLVQYAMGQLEIAPAPDRAAQSEYMVFIGRGMERSTIERRFERAGVSA
jgi:G3E family GTPase